jgi:hypothetical protein
MPGKTLKATLLVCALSLLGGVGQAAAAAWLAPADLSAPNRDASNPTVAMDAAGNTVAAWERESMSGPGRIVQLSTRSAGGSFSAPTTLSEAATKPVAAMTPAGTAVVAWWHFANPPGVSVLEIETRAPGGSFSAPIEVTALPKSVIPQDLELAVNASGDLALAWTSRDPESAVDPSAAFVEASVRPAGGAFSEPAVVSPQAVAAGERATLAGVAIDAAGEAIVAWDHEAAEHEIVEAASRPPGGSFSAGQEVNPPLAAGEDAVSPDLAVDAAGDLTVVWVLATASTDVVEASDLSGGLFSAPVALSEAGEKSFLPEIATSPGGVTTVIWQRAEESNGVIQGRTRSGPGAGFSPPEDVSTAGAGAVFGPRLAINESGEAIVAWSGSGGLEEVVRASIRKPGGGFGPATEISASGPGAMLPAAALDSAGDATVLWPRSNGANNIIQFAGYDAFVPQLRDLSIPATGTVGVPVGFSVSPFDVWSPRAAGFSFGDGAVATGNAVSHSYAKPGAYQVEVTVTDAVGLSSTATGRIEIAPRRDFKIGKLKRNKKKGTGTLTVTVGGPGKVVLSGKKLKKAVVLARAGGDVRVPVRAVGAGLTTLRGRGKLTTPARVAFIPEGGVGGTRAVKVTLVRKHG